MNYLKRKKGGEGWEKGWMGEEEEGRRGKGKRKEKKKKKKKKKIGRGTKK